MKFFKPFDPPVPPVFPTLTVSITDYGAREGKDISSWEAIKKAIEDVHRRGGGSGNRCRS